MRWQAVSFVHWGYEPSALAPLIPEGLELDLWEGRAWVGLVSFYMVDVRPRGLPPIPRLSTFPEINVRTYVRTPDGTDGLLFLTLEAARLPMMLARPTIGVGYTWADMAIDCAGDQVRYRTRRRWPPALASSRHDIEVGEQIAAPSAFDAYLTGRWRAYSRRWGRLLVTPVHHEPWPLHRARLARLDDSLVQSCGIPVPTGEPVVHYAPGVDVRLGVTRPA